MLTKNTAYASLIFFTPICFAKEYLCTPIVVNRTGKMTVAPTPEFSLIFDSDFMTYRTGSYDTRNLNYSNECKQLERGDYFIECRTAFGYTNKVSYLQLNLSRLH